MGEAAGERSFFHAVVRGRVQGVGFRYATIRQARSLGITGRVSNRFDGSVEVEAEGGTAPLQRLLAWLERGPSGAHVSGVEVSWAPYAGRFREFTVEF
jgi:acylphosphatase